VIPAFHTNIIDLEAGPVMWAARGLDYVHFHMRRSVIDDTAAELGYGPVSAFRPVINREDIVLAQIAKSMAPALGESVPSPLALDQLELIVRRASRSAVQRGEASKCRDDPRSRFVQRRRVTELLRANSMAASASPISRERAVCRSATSRARSSERSVFPATDG